MIVHVTLSQNIKTIEIERLSSIQPMIVDNEFCTDQYALALLAKKSKEKVQREAIAPIVRPRLVMIVATQDRPSQRLPFDQYNNYSLYFPPSLLLLRSHSRGFAQMLCNKTGRK